MPAAPIRTIVHPTDLLDHSEPAFLHALALARHLGGRLVAVHVREGDIAPHWDLFAEARSRLHLWGAVAADADPRDIAALGLQLADVRVSKGEVPEVVRRIAVREDADLLVLATHARTGWFRTLGNAVAAPTVQAAGLPALIHRDGTPPFVDPATGTPRIHRVLVPLDHTPDPELAITALLRLLDGIGAVGATLRLFHVGPVGEMPDVRGALPRQGYTVEEAWGEGLPGRAIAAHAAGWNADLVAMATQGRAGLFDALRGSVVEQVVAEAPCPVLAVPAP